MAKYLTPYFGFQSFEDFFDGGFPSFGKFLKGNYFPSVREKEGEYLIETDIPGFKKKEINLKFGEGFLEISAKRESNDKENLEERTFSGKYSLPNYLNLEEKPKAKYENGVLSITFQKKKTKEKGLEKEIKID